MIEGEKIIEVRNLVKYYGNFCAVQDVSFDVYQGDVFGFLGPNGAGKSTTIRTLLSLIAPTSGEIKIFNKNISSHRSEILTDIGCIVEKPDFYKYLSAQQNLQIALRLSGKNIPSKKILETLEFVGLAGREKDKVGGFSHGMKQRLGIAQALIHDPKLIILDEPTTGLDPQGIIDIRNLILQLKNEQNKTVLLSSHILSEIELIANRMVIINKGKTIVQGNVKELLDEDFLEVVFTVDSVEKAKAIIDTKDAHIISSIDKNQITMHLPKEMVSTINKLLCDHQVGVSSIDAKRKLENYFLKLISN